MGGLTLRSLDFRVGALTHVARGHSPCSFVDGAWKLWLACILPFSFFISCKEINVNKHIVSFGFSAALALMGLTGITPSVSAEDIVSCLANCGNAVDTGPTNVVDAPSVADTGHTVAIDTSGADALGLSCSGPGCGGNPEQQTSGGTRIEVSYLDSGETGVSEDPVSWQLTPPAGYAVNIEGYLVTVVLTDGGSRNTLVEKTVADGRGVFASLPGGHIYEVMITDGAWAIPPESRAQFDLCRRFGNNVGNARDMLLGPAAWGSDFCGPIPAYNEETTAPGQELESTFDNAGSADHQVNDQREAENFSTPIESVDDSNNIGNGDSEAKAIQDGDCTRFNGATGISERTLVCAGETVNIGYAETVDGSQSWEGCTVTLPVNAWVEDSDTDPNAAIAAC